MPRKKTVRRKKVVPGSVGLSAADIRRAPGSEAASLAAEVENDGGVVLANYSEPYSGKPVLFIALPIGKVEPTPYQRDVSETHVKRLMKVIEKLDCFLDPIITVRQDGNYWTPNGNHRLQALKKLGARSVVALLIPESELAYKILALNTEKAHNIREKSLEVIRMARALAASSARKEADFAFEFEEAPFLTLGTCYEQRPRFSGGAYQPVLRRIDDFLELPVTKALSVRESRAAQLLQLDDAVVGVTDRLKERGLTSPYLKPFVVARINPIRFSKATSFDYDEVLTKMRTNVGKFNIEKVKQEDLAKTGGPPPVED